MLNNTLVLHIFNLFINNLSLVVLKSVGWDVHWLGVRFYPNLVFRAWQRHHDTDVKALEPGLLARSSRLLLEKNREMKTDLSCRRRRVDLLRRQEYVITPTVLVTPVHRTLERDPKRLHF